MLRIKIPCNRATSCNSSGKLKLPSSQCLRLACPRTDAHSASAAMIKRAYHCSRCSCGIVNWMSCTLHIHHMHVRDLAHACTARVSCTQSLKAIRSLFSVLQTRKNLHVAPNLSVRILPLQHKSIWLQGNYRQRLRHTNSRLLTLNIMTIFMHICRIVRYVFFNGKRFSGPQAKR